MALNGMRREKAAMALARGLNVKRAAEESGVGLRTLHRWLATESAFRQRVDELGNDLLLQASRRISDLAEQAANALGELLSSQHDNIRLQAARIGLDSAANQRHVRDLAARLAALERISPPEDDPCSA